MKVWNSVNAYVSEVANNIGLDSRQDLRGLGVAQAVIDLMQMIHIVSKSKLTLCD